MKLNSIKSQILSLYQVASKANESSMLLEQTIAELSLTLIIIEIIMDNIFHRLIGVFLIMENSMIYQ